MMIHTHMIHLPSCTGCHEQTRVIPLQQVPSSASDSSEAMQGNVHEEHIKGLEAAI